MRARDLVDPQLLPALGILQPLVSTNAETLEALRAAIDASARLQIKTTDLAGVTVREVHAPTRDGTVRLMIYAPEVSANLRPAVLHLHGGGLVMGRPEMRHAALVELARDVGCVVCSVDYRLAPEHPCPAAIDDAFAALNWLASEAKDLRVDPQRIVLAGESAGGGLAAALAIRVHDEGALRPRAQVLIYPMLDDRTGVIETPRGFEGDLVWGAAANRFAWAAYLGGMSLSAICSKDNAVVPLAYAAPARAENLANLPPTFIGIGALDIFLDEALTYAARLAAAGVPVEAHVYPGAYHGFDNVPDAAVSAQLTADWKRALQRMLA